MAAKAKKRGQAPGSMHIDKRAERLLIDQLAEGPDDEHLTLREVAAWLAVSPQFLEIARMRGTGPRFTQLAPKVIRYTRGDVKRWLKSRLHYSTSEYAEKKKAR